MESLRRVDTSITFRSYGFVSVVQIVELFVRKLKQGQSNLERTFTYIIENSISLIDISMANIASASEDSENLLSCAITLIGAIAESLGLLIKTSPPNSSSKSISALVRIWDTLYRTSKYTNAQFLCVKVMEAMATLVSLSATIQASPTHSNRTFLSKVQVANICKDVMIRRSEFPLLCLHEVVEAVGALIEFDPIVMCEVRYF
jgi:hypothetical protein